MSEYKAPKFKLKKHKMPKIKIGSESEIYGEKLEGNSNEELEYAPVSKHIKLRPTKRKMTIYGETKRPFKTRGDEGEGTIYYRGIKKERLESREAKRLGMSIEEYQARKKKHLRIKRK